MLSLCEIGFGEWWRHMAWWNGECLEAKGFLRWEEACDNVRLLGLVLDYNSHIHRDNMGSFVHISVDLGQLASIFIA